MSAAARAARGPGRPGGHRGADAGGAATRAPAGRPRPTVGQVLHEAAFLLLLAVLAGRLFVGEFPHRVPASPTPARLAAQQGAEDLPVARRSQPARALFAVALLAAGGLWLAGAAAGAPTALRPRWLVVGVAAFAALAAVSASRASDARAAWLTWLEQVALLAAGALAALLCASPAGRARRTVLVAVLAGLAATLAIKGLYQVAVEIPETAAYFEAYGGDAGGDPTSRELLAVRVHARTPSGYIALGNLFASALLVLGGVAVGAAIDALAAAWRDRRRWRPTARRGELHVPSLLALGRAVAAAAIVAVLLLTRSRGAILAGALCAAGGVAAWVLRGWLGRHWRAAFAAGVLGLAAGLGAMTLWGLRTGGLPTRTMTFRWHYWTGAARAISERPVFGVGPGNFPAAYLRHRPAGAEEEVRNPHNAGVHAAAEYGLAGGAVYVALLLGVLGAALRPQAPAAGGPGDHLDAPPRVGAAERWRAPAAVVVCAAAVLAARAWFDGLLAVPAALLLYAVVPAVVLAGLIVAAGLWWPGRGLVGQAGPAVRVALPAALVAFVIHNLVTFSLWMPATGLLFWVAAGALLARPGAAQPPTRRARRMLLPVAALWVAAAAGAAVLVAAPVFRRAANTEAALAAYARGDAAAAARWARRAAEADPLDAVAAGDATTLALATTPRRRGPGVQAGLAEAQRWAREATRRHPAQPDHWRRLGRIEYHRRWPDTWRYNWDGITPRSARETIRRYEEAPNEWRRRAGPLALSDLAGAHYARQQYARAAELCRRALEQDASWVLHAHLGDAAWRAGQRAAAREAWRKAARPGQQDAKWIAALDQAVRLDPRNHRLRADYAARLRFAGPAGARRGLEQLAAAEGINAAFTADSVKRFTPAEHDRLEMLRACARLLAD